MEYYGGLFALLESGLIRAINVHPYVYGGSNTNGGIMPSITNVIQLQEGSNSVYALCGDGSVWSWGYNYYARGNLGQPDIGVNGYGSNDITGYYRPPALVDGIGPGSGAIKIVSRLYGLMILFSDGTVKGFGENNNDVLLQGTNDDRLLQL